MATITENKALYTARTHTTGGRSGQSRSSDGRLDVKLSVPGSTGQGTNPEQLFAAGCEYSLGARMNISIPGVERAIAQQLVDAAEKTCPYSKATRGNIPVSFTLV